MEWLLKNSVAGETWIGRRALARSGLRPLIQEYHFRTIYGVRLPPISTNKTTTTIKLINQWITLTLILATCQKNTWTIFVTYMSILPHQLQLRQFKIGRKIKKVKRSHFSLLKVRIQSEKMSKSPHFILKCVFYIFWTLAAQRKKWNVAYTLTPNYSVRSSCIFVLSFFL